MLVIDEFQDPLGDKAEKERFFSKVNSRIVLDDGGAEALLGKGDLLANLGRGLVRAQAPLLSQR